MTEQTENLITASVVDGHKITFVNGNTGVETLYIIKGNSIALSKGFVYEIPINEKELELSDHYLVKVVDGLTAKCLILNISNGKATIYPIVNGIIISNGDLLGRLI